MPNVPADAKKPTDHEKPKTAEAEIVFTYDNKQYLIDPVFRDDLEILEWLQDDLEVKAVKRILGEKQWEQWKEDMRGDDGRVKVSEAEPFLKALFEELKAGN